MDLLEEKIKSLLDNNIGDYIRLYEMLDRHKSGKTLYNSDVDYIEKLSPTTSESKVEEKPINLEELRKSQPKLKSNNDTITTRKLPDVFCSYAISYNTRYINEVKIHSNTCHHVQRASQTGSVKWTYAKSLKEALQITKKLYPEYGDGKFPRCCLYNGASYFECDNCKRYSDSYPNTHKHHSAKVRVVGILLIVMAVLVAISGIMPTFGLQLLSLIAGIIVLAVENHIAPIVCSNCLSKKYHRWTLSV